MNMRSIVEYCKDHTTREPDVLARLNRETHLTQVYPQMLSGHLQGTLLRMICHMLQPERILEIGAFTGYSAIAMALGMADVPAGTARDRRRREPVLHTIEANPELEDGIRQFIREAGLERRIVLHMGDAKRIIPELDERWDLVFIDADKPNYLSYYEMTLPAVRPGGFIIADNVLWDGKVTGDRAKMDRDTLGIVEFNEFVRDDGRVENLMLPVRDGLMIIRKR